MAKGKGLGRGLEAIFAEEVPVQNTPVGIRLSEIEPNPRQPRQDFDPAALEDLAQSIRENGIITPITLRKQGILIRLSPVNAAGGPAVWQASTRSRPSCWTWTSKPPTRWRSSKTCSERT